MYRITLPSHSPDHLGRSGKPGHLDGVKTHAFRRNIIFGIVGKGKKKVRESVSLKSVNAQEHPAFCWYPSKPVF